MDICAYKHIFLGKNLLFKGAAFFCKRKFSFYKCGRRLSRFRLYNRKKSEQMFKKKWQVGLYKWKIRGIMVLSKGRRELILRVRIFRLLEEKKLPLPPSIDLKEIGLETVSFFLGVHWRMDSRGIGLGGWGRSIYEFILYAKGGDFYGELCKDDFIYVSKIKNVGGGLRSAYREQGGAVAQVSRRPV